MKALLLFVLLVGQVHATEELRASITRGLGFLAKEGDAWIAKEKCLACHHQPMIFWSHAEAQRRGFAVDAQQLQGWLKWSATYTDAKGGPEVLALWLLAAPPAPLQPADSMRPAELVKFILATQQPPGSWRPTGRLAQNQQRPPVEATEFVTRLTLLGLMTADASDAKAAAARERALKWLIQTAAPQSFETLVFRALVAQPGGQADELFKQVLAQQHADGGWSWRMGGTKSDSLATGLALYALRDVKAEQAGEAVTHARIWLLTTQREDGAWPVQSSLISALPGADHLKVTDGLYTAWGSAWAVIGLLQAFPVVK